MDAMAFRITGHLNVFNRPMQADIEGDIKSSRYYPFVRVIHRDRWIPLTKGH